MNFTQSVKDTVFKKKVAIIGAGFVGSTTAYALMMNGLAREIVLVDANKKAADGEILDLGHGLPSMGSAHIYHGDYSDCRDTDLIIISAGRGRREGETRLDMAAGNLAITKEVLQNLSAHYNKGIIVLITNPVDIVSHKAIEWTNLPIGKVFGTGCLLDSSRFIRAIADHFKVNTELVNAMVIGEHGDSQVPVWSKVTIAGVPLKDYCQALNITFTEADKEAIASKVKTMGADIIVTKGKTHFGIATAVASLADAILNGRTTIATVCTTLEGEHGVSGITASVPCIVTNNGVEKRLIDDLAPDELELFKQSCNKLKEVLATVDTE